MRKHIYVGMDVHIYPPRAEGSDGVRRSLGKGGSPWPLPKDPAAGRCASMERSETRFSPWNGRCDASHLCQGFGGQVAKADNGCPLYLLPSNSPKASVGMMKLFFHEPSAINSLAGEN